jgi:chromosome partitioning protein
MSLKHCINATTLEHDVVLIDTPTNLGIHVLNALAASTDVLLPVETSVLSLSNLERTKTYVGKIQERVNPALNILGIIPTRVDTQTVLDQDVIDELHNEPFEVFEPVPKSVRVKEAPDYNQSIIAYEPTNKASKAYMSIARRLLEVIHGK